MANEGILLSSYEILFLLPTERKLVRGCLIEGKRGGLKATDCNGTGRMKLALLLVLSLCSTTCHAQLLNNNGHGRESARYRLEAHGVCLNNLNFQPNSSAADAVIDPRFDHTLCLVSSRLDLEKMDRMVGGRTDRQVRLKTETDRYLRYRYPSIDNLTTTRLEMLASSILLPIGMLQPLESLFSLKVLEFNFYYGSPELYSQYIDQHLTEVKYLLEKILPVFCNDTTGPTIWIRFVNTLRAVRLPRMGGPDAISLSIDRLKAHAASRDFFHHTSLGRIIRFARRKSVHVFGAFQSQNWKFSPDAIHELFAERGEPAVNPLTFSLSGDIVPRPYSYMMYQILRPSNT